MDISNVQVQTPSSKTAATTVNTNSTASATSSSTSSEASSSTFINVLVKVIEDQAAGEQVEISTEATSSMVSTEAASSMVAAILPPAITNLISSQPADEEIKGTIQQLVHTIQTMDPEKLPNLIEQPDLRQPVINANIQQLIHTIQTMDPEKLQSLIEHPEVQEWMTKVNQLLTQEQNSTIKSNNLQDVSILTITQPTELKSNATNELVAVLTRFLDVIETNPNGPIVQQLGSELKFLTTKLSESFPALSSVPGTQLEVNKVEALKTDKTTSTSMNNIQSVESKSSSHNSGETLNQQEPKNSQSQLLQRLAYTSHNVNTVVVNANANVSHAVESQVATETTSLSVEASLTQQDDATLTVTQLESTKQASVPSEVKVPMQSVSAQEFADEMSRFVVKNMSITQLNGVSEAKISLLPDHLGQVDVKISVINGQITAHFIAESAQARDLLELQLPQLRASLQQQGLQVDKLNVEHQNNLGNSMFQDQRQQHASQNFNQNSKKNTRDYDQYGADFSLEMDQAVRVNRLAYGNTFNATA